MMNQVLKIPTVHLVDLLLNDGPPREGRQITISVYLSHPTDSKLASEAKNQVLISAISVSGKTKWDILDVTVKRSFKEYCLRIDPSTNLGLNAESVNCYQIGEITRSKGTLRTLLDSKIVDRNVILNILLLSVSVRLTFL